jgi:hypothetical protein
VKILKDYVVIPLNYIILLIGDKNENKPFGSSIITYYMNRAEALRLLNLDDASASQDNIKIAYHELSKKYHPDKNKDGVSHEIFIMIKKAHDFLLEAPEPEKAQTQAPQTHAKAQAPQTTQATQAPTHDTQKVLDEFLRKINSASYVNSLKNLPIRIIKLQDACKKLGIDIMKISTSSHRPIKKTKDDLWSNMVKTQEFKKLYTHSYDKLVQLCEDKKISIVDDNSKPKPREELILDLILT